MYIENTLLLAPARHICKPFTVCKKRNFFGLREYSATDIIKPFLNSDLKRVDI